METEKPKPKKDNSWINTLFLGLILGVLITDAWIGANQMNVQEAPPATYSEETLTLVRSLAAQMDESQSEIDELMGQYDDSRLIYERFETEDYRQDSYVQARQLMIAELQMMQLQSLSEQVGLLFSLIEVSIIGK